MLGASTDKLCGKVIHEVMVDNRKPVRIRTRVPSRKHLFNFDLKAGGQTWLILDGYGDEILPDTVVDRVLGAGAYSHGYALAINKATGEIYTAHFGTEKKRGRTTNYVLLSPLETKVPKNFLKRIDELKSCKRPFFLSFTDTVYVNLLIQEIGYQGLEKELVVDLDFRPFRVQVWGNSYRLVSNWK